MNNHFTLYIDESGDFKSPSKPWLIGGLIIEKPFKNSEDILSNLVSPLNSKHQLQRQSDFHLTEIRQKRGNDKALQLASDLFSCLDVADIKSCFVTTVNHTKTSAHTAERTYRLMLLDLIIQAETAIYEMFNKEITKLDLVIATRTIDRIRQTTTVDIDEEILKSLTRAVESDLVASGKIALLKNIEVHMRDAKYQWGLICADFICNMTYNQKFEENNEILNELKTRQQLFPFKTFSSPELRRILNHERNQNYINALYDSLKLVDKYPKNKDYQSTLLRLIRTVFTQTGSTGSKIYFEGFLERIWRDQSVYQSYGEKLNILLKFLNLLESSKNELNIRNFNSYKFKLKNLALLCLNHIGDISRAEETVQEQESIINLIVSDPNNFPMILDFQARKIEIYVNALDFEQAEVLAKAHWDTIDEYRNIWELISPDIDEPDFLSSNIAIRAKSTLIRSSTLNYKKHNALTITSYIDEITPHLNHKFDKSRIFCLRILLLSKEFRLEEAIEVAIEHINTKDDIQEFDYFFFIFALNQKLLVSDKPAIKELIGKFNNVVDIIIANEFSRQYINMLRYRELSLFYHFKGLKKESHECLKKAQSLELSAQSPIAKYLSVMNSVQLDFIKNKIKDVEDYDAKYPEFGLKNISSMQSRHTSCLLFDLRYFLAS